MKITHIILAAGMALISSSIFAQQVELNNVDMVVSTVDVTNIADKAKSEAYQTIGSVSGSVHIKGRLDMTVNAHSTSNVANGYDSLAEQKIGVIGGH